VRERERNADVLHCVAVCCSVLQCVVSDNMIGDTGFGDLAGACV